MPKSKLLTDKQVEVMELVCGHYQTKEIARILDISPRSVDQRIDAARSKLGANTRVEAARVFAERFETPHSITGKPIPVSELDASEQPPERSPEFLRFSDVAGSGDPVARTGGEFPKLSPRDFGKTSRLLIIIGLAILLIILVTSGLVLVQQLEVVVH